MKESKNPNPAVPVQRLETGWYMPEVLYHHLSPYVAQPEPPVSLEKLLSEVTQGDIQSSREANTALSDSELTSRLNANAEAMAKLAIPNWIHPLH